MSCTFCAIAAGDLPAHLVVDRPGVLAFLDARPVFKGHALVIPRQHVDTFTDATSEVIAAVMGTAQDLAKAVTTALAAQGSFVAMNNVVSQSVPHLHIHVMPRTRGDGLRGFFWPRGKYADDAEAAEYAARLRNAIASP